MGIFCMIFGPIVFLGFGAFGAIFPTLEVSFYTAGPFVQFFSLTNEPLPYIIVFGLMGFLVGLPIFMQGLIYHKLGKIERRRAR